MRGAREARRLEAWATGELRFAEKKAGTSSLLNQRFDCFVRSASLIARACTQRENIRGNMICAA